MELLLYRYRKRIKSTGIPDSSTATRFDCQPRRALSVKAPVVTIKAETLVGYTYAFIPRYDRYYWVTDLKPGPGGYWVVSLSVDPLASARSDILAQPSYVIRTAKRINQYLTDTFYPTQVTVRQKTTDIATPFEQNMYGGTFIVGIVNDIRYATSTAVTYYAMAASEFGNLLETLHNRTAMSDILGITLTPEGIVEGLTGCLEGISYDVYLSMLNPIQYIVSAIYIPIARNKLSVSEPLPLKLGDWTMSTAKIPTIGYFFEFQQTVSYSVVAPNNAFEAFPPFSNYFIHFPGFGVQELPGDIVGGLTSFDLRFVADSFNGNAYLYINNPSISAKNGNITTMTGNIGIPVPVTQILANTDLVQQGIGLAAQAGMKIGDGGVSKSSGSGMSFWEFIQPNGVLDEMSGMNKLLGMESTVSTKHVRDLPFTGILDGTHLMQEMKMAGSPGGCAALVGKGWLMQRYRLPVGIDRTKYGNLYNNTVDSLQDVFPGYVQTKESNVTTLLTAEETEAVNAYLDSGVYLE